MRGEAFPHEHHSGDAVPAVKFASGIEEHAIRVVCAAGERFAGESDAQWQSAQLCTDFLQPFDMTRRDEQTQRWKLFAQPKKNSSQDFFFATMRATTKEHQAFRGFGRRVPKGSGYRYALRLNIRIEFNAAGHVDSVSRDTKRCPSFDVARLWYAHQIEQSKRWRDKKAKPSIASFRTRR